MVEIIKVAAVLLSIVLDFLLGALVLKRNLKSIVNRAYFLVAFSFFFWGLALFFYQYPFIFSSLFWIKLDYIMVMSFVISILVFSFVFPQTVFRKTWGYAGAFVFTYLAVSLWMLFFTNLWVVDVVVDPQEGLQTVFGPYYLWFTGWTWLVLLWGVINLVRKGKYSSPIQKLQMSYLWIGFVLFGITVCTLDVLIPIFWGLQNIFLSVC